MDRHPLRVAFERQDLDGIVATLSDDVVFHSPVISGIAFHGRAAVRDLYAIVLKEFGDFEYIHESEDAGTRVLVATARVRGVDVRITLMVEHDAAGQVREIWAMSRPLRGGVAIVEAIGSNLAGGGARGRALAAGVKPLAAGAAAVDLLASRLIGRLNETAT